MSPPSNIRGCCNKRASTCRNHTCHVDSSFARPAAAGGSSFGAIRRRVSRPSSHLHRATRLGDRGGQQRRARIPRDLAHRLAFHRAARRLPAMTTSVCATSTVTGTAASRAASVMPIRRAVIHHGSRRSMCPNWYPTEEGAKPDERVDRDGALAPASRDRVQQARARLIDSLAALAEREPSDAVDHRTARALSRRSGIREGRGRRGAPLLGRHACGARSCSASRCMRPAISAAPIRRSTPRRRRCRRRTAASGSAPSSSSTRTAARRTTT